MSGLTVTAVNLSKTIVEFYIYSGKVKLEFYTLKSHPEVAADICYTGLMERLILLT